MANFYPINGYDEKGYKKTKESGATTRTFKKDKYRWKYVRTYKTHKEAVFDLSWNKNRPEWNKEIRITKNRGQDPKWRAPKEIIVFRIWIGRVIKK